MHMNEDKKKKWLKGGIAVLIIIFVLNIPIVSDVIAVARMGWLHRVIAIEKIQYDGEEHNLFVFKKRELYEEYGETVVYAVENNIFRAKVRIWEPCTGITGHTVKPTIGDIYQEDSEHFTPGTEPREKKEKG